MIVTVAELGRCPQEQRVLVSGDVYQQDPRHPPLTTARSPSNDA